MASLAEGSWPPKADWGESMKASLPEKNNKDLRITEALLWVCSLRDCKKINHNKEREGFS